MAEALAQSPSGLRWQIPKGGFYFWCRLPSGAERAVLLTRAAEHGVAFLPGWACFVDDPGETHVRLNFSFPSPECIAEGVRRLMAAAKDATSSTRRARTRAAETRPVV